MNRATADNQSAQSEEEGLEPTKEWVKDLVDEIIAEEFSSPDLELHWLDEDDNDSGRTEAALESRVKLGAVTLNEMRGHLGLDPFANVAADRPMVLTPTGFVPIEAGLSSPAGLTRGSMLPGGSMDCWIEHGKENVLQKYSPNQPRVPAGNTDGGQWTNESAPASTLDPVGPGVQYAQLNVQNKAKTGNPQIDQTTETLLQTLARIHALAGGGSGPWYGTRIHLMFANDVRLQNLPGIGRNGVEQSFSLGDIADYGEDGTVRVDVFMRDESGNIIAIWDVKTGGAVLTGARVSQLRAEAGVGRDVPVIELHVTRGATFKARTRVSALNIVAVTR